MADRHRNRDAAWWREYRQRRRDDLRRYWAARARAAYVKHPRIRLRAPRKPKAAELRALRARRLENAAVALRAEQDAAAAICAADPELQRLAEAQARDARSYRWSYTPEFLDGARRYRQDY